MNLELLPQNREPQLLVKSGCRFPCIAPNQVGMFLPRITHARFDEGAAQAGTTDLRSRGHAPKLKSGDLGALGHFHSKNTRDPLQTATSESPEMSGFWRVISRKAR